MARESLNDLIVAGLLKPGDELTCEPRKGELYKATVEAGGKISYNGKPYDSPSGWACEVAGNSRSGLRDVRFNGIQLKELRKKLGKPGPVQEIKGPGSEPKEISAELTAQNTEQQLHAKLLNLDPSSFERVVGKVLEALGLPGVAITGSSHDGGIDGHATMPVVNIRVAFQAKKYAEGNNVAGEAVRALIGTVVNNRYDRGILITTSSFTAGAKEEAEKPDSRIVLLDGQSLVKLMVEKGIGIARVPVVRDELDEDFFGGLSTPGA